MSGRRAGSVGGLILVLVMASGASAQEDDAAVDASIVPIEATIVDVEATIIDLDGGTRTTRSTEKVTIALAADVFFEFDEFDLLPDAVNELEQVAADIEAAGITEVAISGHTDDVGDDDYNQQLSERRAESVETYLSDRLSGVTFSSEGFGASQPIAANEIDGEDHPEGRAQNRRVEITYAGPGR